MKAFFNDATAIEEVSKGNIDGYKYLFDQHFGDLCNFLNLYLHDKTISEEIALDIFAYIWEKREKLEIKTSFKGYLIGAAKKRAISEYRRSKNKLFSELSVNTDQISDNNSPEKSIESKELQSIITHAIEALPEKSRIVYQLAWEENLSHKEISDRLGISVKTVENHVGIALRKLRKKLLPHYNQIFTFLVFSMIL